MSDVTVVIGAGQIGQAIARRVSQASTFCSPIFTRPTPTRRLRCWLTLALT